MADQLQQAIKLMEAGSFDRANSLLLELLKGDPRNDVAWFWMSKVVATDELSEECLQEALKHNPKNALDRGSDGAPDRCQAEYQFMAYAALRQGAVAVPCSDWNRLDDSRLMQVQYLVTQPDRSRAYPPAETTERYAVVGFGLAALLIIVGVVLIVWRFWPRKLAS